LSIVGNPAGIELGMPIEPAGGGKVTAVSLVSTL
jgi:hypothetical protein